MDAFSGDHSLPRGSPFPKLYIQMAAIDATDVSVIHLIFFADGRN